MRTFVLAMGLWALILSSFRFPGGDPVPPIEDPPLPVEEPCGGEPCVPDRPIGLGGGFRLGGD